MASTVHVTVEDLLALPAQKPVNSALDGCESLSFEFTVSPEFLAAVRAAESRVPADSGLVPFDKSAAETIGGDGEAEHCLGLPPAFVEEAINVRRTLGKEALGEFLKRHMKTDYASTTAAGHILVRTWIDWPGEQAAAPAGERTVLHSLAS